MARLGPLDHPTLRQIEALLDQQELDGAKRALAALGSSGYYELGASFLATRLLMQRGRLSPTDVAERIRALLEEAPDFAEARTLLHQLEAGEVVVGPPKPSVAPGPDTERRGASGWPLNQSTAPPSPESDGPTLRSPPPSAPPWDAERDEPSSPDPAFPLLRQSNRPSAPPQPRAARAAARSAPHHTPEISFGEETLDLEGGANQAGGPRRHASMPAMEKLHPRIPKAPPLPYFSVPPDPTPSYLPKRAPSVEMPAVRVVNSPSSMPPAAGSLGLRKDVNEAGRYSRAPAVVERTRATPSSPPSVPPPSSGHGSPYTAPPEPTPTVRTSPSGRIRSGLPAGFGEARPTVFEVANLLDRGLFDEAVRRLALPELDTDLALMRVRALVGADRRAEARAAAQELARLELLDPEQRANVARLLLELDDVRAAFDCAKAAWDAAPDAPMTRLTYAWAAARLARRGDKNMLDAVRSALGGLSGRGPRPSLVLALRACDEAVLGDPERAFGIAQRALGLDHDSVDALAAIVTAAIRLGRKLDAQQAFLRLASLAPAEAAALRPALEAAGVPPSDVPVPRSRPGREWWDPVEVALADGHRTAVLRAFEQACRSRLLQLAEATREDSLSLVADVAATFLTAAPVWRNFAPYDFSLFSVGRVDAVLALLYGSGQEPQLDTDEFPALLIVGAYLGESLARAAGGRWEGTVRDVDSTCVVIGNYRFRPFDWVVDRMRRAESLLPSALARFGTPAELPKLWRARTLPQEAPPCPWRGTLPTVDSLPGLARALTGSPIDLWTMSALRRELDGSLATLDAIDAFCELLAPAASPADASPRWSARMVGVLGAYVGELCVRHGRGHWAVTQTQPDRPEDYVVNLGDGGELRPLALVAERLGRDRRMSIATKVRPLLGTRA